MSFFNNFKNINYKYCNLTALTAFGLFQSSRYFLNRSSSEVVDSYINSKEAETYFSDGLTEPIKPKKEDVKLKKLDSNGFWAILENKNKKEYIYMKCKDLKKNLPTMTSLKEYKDKPYLLKKNLIQLKSNISKDGQLSGWSLTKTTDASPPGSLYTPKTGFVTLGVFSIGFLCTLAFGVYKSVNLIKTLPCVNFIKSSLREHKKVKEIIGNKVVIRNLEGELSGNYFNGDVVIYGNGTQQLLINLVVMRDNTNVPFKLLKLNIKEMF